jgi:hypothetical protein
MLKKFFAASLGLFVLLSLTIPSTLASPDTYIRQEVYIHPIEMFGEIIIEGEKTYTDIWMSKAKMRTDSYDEQGRLIHSTILRDGKMYSINHADKTYTEVEMSGVDIPTDTDMEVTVTSTSERKNINNWNCQKYIVEVKSSGGEFDATITQTIWATEDIKIDYDRYTSSTELVNPGIVKEWEKIKGYPVETIMEIGSMEMTMTTTTKVVDYAQKSSPKGIYDIPQGYTKKSS